MVNHIAAGPADAAASLWVLKPQCQTDREVEIHIKLLKKGLKLRSKTYIGSVNYKGDKTVFSNDQGIRQEEALNNL